jgi:hypothetical protein
VIGASRLRIELGDGLGRARDRQREAVRAVHGAARVPARERRGSSFDFSSAASSAVARALCLARVEARAQRGVGEQIEQRVEVARQARDPDLGRIPVGARGEVGAERRHRLGVGERVALARAALEQLGHE